MLCIPIAAVFMTMLMPCFNEYTGFDDITSPCVVSDIISEHIPPASDWMILQLHHHALNVLAKNVSMSNIWDF